MYVFIFHHRSNSETPAFLHKSETLVHFCSATATEPNAVAAAATAAAAEEETSDQRTSKERPIKRKRRNVKRPNAAATAATAAAAEEDIPALKTDDSESSSEDEGGDVATGSKRKRTKKSKSNAGKKSVTVVFKTDKDVEKIATRTSSLVEHNEVKDAFAKYGHFTVSSVVLTFLASMLLGITANFFFDNTVTMQALLAPMAADVATDLLTKLRAGTVHEPIAGNTQQMSLVQAAYRLKPETHALYRGLVAVLGFIPLLLIEVGPLIDLAFAALGVYGAYTLIDFKILMTAPGKGLQILHADAMSNGIVMLFFLTEANRTQFLVGCGVWFEKIKRWLEDHEAGADENLGEERAEQLWLRELLYTLLQNNPIGGTLPAGAVLLFPAFMLHFAPANVLGCLRLVAFLYFEAKQVKLAADLGEQMFSWILHRRAATVANGKPGHDVDVAEFGDMFAINERQATNPSATACTGHLDVSERKPALASMQRAGRETTRIIPLHADHQVLEHLCGSQAANVKLLTEMGLHAKHFHNDHRLVWKYENLLTLNTGRSRHFSKARLQGLYLVLMFVPAVKLTVTIKDPKQTQKVVVGIGSAFSLEGDALRTCIGLSFDSAAAQPVKGLFVAFTREALAPTPDCHDVQYELIK